MRILHIVGAKVWGGGEQYVYNVCKEEKRRGQDVFVAVDKNQKNMVKRYQEVATVLKVDLRTVLGLASFVRLSKIILEEKIEFINIHTGKLALLGVLLKGKSSNSKLILFRHNLLPNKTDLYHKWLQKKVDAFVCVSRAVYNLQVNTIQNIYKQKVKLVYNGIDLDRFPDLKVKKESKSFVIGYAGRLVENKGLLVLIEAFSRLKEKHPNLKLKLTGQAEGGFAKELESLIMKKDLENSAFILPYDNDINEFYRSLDVFVLPSIVKEAFGLVICEAMACKIPVISTNSGAQEEIITNGVNGIIVKPDDVEELVNALDLLYNDEDLRLKLVNEAESVVKDNFTINTCVKGIEGIYENIK